MYCIIFDIENDSDFTFKNDDILIEFTDTFEDATERLKERFENLVDTITGKDIAVKSIIDKVNLLLKNFDLSIKGDYYSDGFDAGNWMGDFSIQKVNCNKNNGITTYIIK